MALKINVKIVNAALTIGYYGILFKLFEFEKKLTLGSESRKLLYFLLIGGIPLLTLGWIALNVYLISKGKYEYWYSLFFHFFFIGLAIIIENF